MDRNDNSVELTKLIQKNREQLERDFNNNFEIQSKTLSIITGGLEHADFNRFGTASLVWNISGYLNLISYDLKIIGRDLMFSQDDFQRKHYARQMYLLIYESMDDFLSLLGKPLRNAIKNFDNSPLYLAAVQTITAQLNSFKKDNETKIKAVRHTAIAHRDKNMLIQLQTIDSISWDEAINILGKYDAIVRDLGQVCQQLMNRTLDELHQNEKTSKV